MIIGQFCDTYPPAVDGVGRVCLSYCQTLNAMGHLTYYIGPNAPDTMVPDHTRVILSASMKVPGELFRMGLPALDMVYRRRVNKVRFDIVHSHDPFIAGAEALRVSKKLHIPLVSTFHSKYYDDALAKSHSEWFANEVVKSIVSYYNKCDSVWTVNNATADVLREYGYKGPILVVENGTNIEPLDPEACARMRESLVLKEGIPTLLFVGQHNYKKNLHGILGACAILKRQGQPFQLICVGDGPDFDRILHESRSLGIDEESHFLGFVQDRSLLMAVYNRADLLVFPSLYDNAPMVLREAAMMGTPGLVVSGSCSAEGVKDSVNGFISPDESAESIAATILRALPKVKEAGERAKETIPVPWPRIMKQVASEYERLIAERKHTGA